MQKSTTLSKISRTGMIILVLLTGMFMLPRNISAQEKTDFSGTWKLNESKSSTDEGRFRMGTPTLTVTQKENEMKVDRIMRGRDDQERTFTSTYSLDGKETSQEAFRGTTTSVAGWSDNGKSLTITTTRKMERDGQTMEMKTTEVWTLTEGGNSLTITSTSNTPRGEMKVTLVYDKQQD
ncbi:MAG: hypothetical protein ACP5D1_07780 [Bacteroidales bacterium]